MKSLDIDIDERYTDTQCVGKSIITHTGTVYVAI